MWVRVDLYEEGDFLVAAVELPGVCGEDLTISVAARCLVLRGRRRASNARGRTYHRQERSPTCFHREIPLPTDIAPEGVEATIIDGILTVRLPIEKSEAPGLCYRVAVD